MQLATNNTIIDFSAINNVPNEIKELKTLLLSLFDRINAPSAKPKDEKEYLNIKETAKYLDYSVSHLYSLTFSNQIPFYKPNGKRILFKKDELDKWISQSKRKSSIELDEKASEYISNKRAKLTN